MGFGRGNNSKYAGVAGADLENAPQGPVPFTSPFGIPITRISTWHAGGTVPGAATGVPGTPVQHVSGNPGAATAQTYVNRSPYGGGAERTAMGNYPGRPPAGPGAGGRYSPATSGTAGDPNPVTFAQAIPQFGQRVLTQSQETAVR